MIPRAHITDWRSRAPWPSDAQVEQDLVLSRALVEMFSEPRIARSCALRGGTALHKLYLPTPARYSEDIDLVQAEAGSIGPALNAMRGVLDPWLGAAQWKQGAGRVTLNYRFESSSMPVQRMRLKIEIHTREHFAVLGFHEAPFAVQSPWFAENATIRTYRIEELLGTKLRALYQRKKGRDLFDLWRAASSIRVEDRGVLACFERYMHHSGARVSRAEFEENLLAKLADKAFAEDIAPLLKDPESYAASIAGDLVLTRFVAKLPGQPWKRPPLPPR